MLIEQLWKVNYPLWRFMHISKWFVLALAAVIILVKVISIIYDIISFRDNMDDALNQYREELTEWSDCHTRGGVNFPDKVPYWRPAQVLWPLDKIKLSDIDECKGNLAIFSENTAVEYIRTNPDFEITPALRRVLVTRNGDGLTRHLQVFVHDSRYYKAKPNAEMGHILYHSLLTTEKQEKIAATRYEKEPFVFDASAYTAGKPFEKQLFNMAQGIFDSELVKKEFEILLKHIGYKNIVFLFDNIGKLKSDTAVHSFVKDFVRFAKRYNICFILAVNPDTLTKEDTDLLNTIPEVLAESLRHDDLPEIARWYHSELLARGIISGYGFADDFIDSLYDAEFVYHHIGTLRDVLNRTAGYDMGKRREQLNPDSNTRVWF